MTISPPGSCFRPRPAWGRRPAVRCDTPRTRRVLRHKHLNQATAHRAPTPSTPGKRASARRWEPARKIAKRARIVLIGADGHGGAIASLPQGGVLKPGRLALAGGFCRGSCRGLDKGRGHSAESRSACDQKQNCREDREGARPANATPWSVPTMPRRSASATRACNGSGPGRMKKFKVFDGPDFVTKAEDVAGKWRSG
jgi:hypothetical protein